MTQPKFSMDSTTTKINHPILLQSQPKPKIKSKLETTTTILLPPLPPPSSSSSSSPPSSSKLPDLQVIINRDNELPIKRKHSSPPSSTTNDHYNLNRSHQQPQPINSSSFDNLDPESAEHQQLKKLTTEKRKAQNRAAQRNFREKKEKQCKRNEENLIIRTEENKKMRELISLLENENTFLRQHVPESVLEQARKSFPARPELSTLVIPISAYDEFLGPEQKSSGVGGGISESEEHARAATALSSLAAAPIDPVFDPQLQHLAGPSPSATLIGSNNDNNLRSHHHHHQQQQQQQQPDLIVPFSTNNSLCSSANTPSIPAPSTYSHQPDHLLHSNNHQHHHQHHHHKSHPPPHQHEQFGHHQGLLHDKLFVNNHHS